MKSEILALLREQGSYISGQELCERFGVSRTAVWKAVNQLKKLAGCEMHCSHMPTPGDEAGLRKLGINLTCDPAFASRDLFID